MIPAKIYKPKSVGVLQALTFSWRPDYTSYGCACALNGVTLGHFLTVLIPPKKHDFGAQFQKWDWSRTWRMTVTLIGPQTILFPISIWILPLFDLDMNPVFNFNLNIAAFWPGDICCFFLFENCTGGPDINFHFNMGLHPGTGGIRHFKGHIFCNKLFQGQTIWHYNNDICKDSHELWNQSWLSLKSVKNMSIWNDNEANIVIYFFQAMFSRLFL